MEAPEGTAPEAAPEETPEGEAITGDHGMQPQSSLDHDSSNAVHATSPPPPEAQSGVPLEADRAAGVQPGDRGVVPGPTRTAEQVAADEEAEGTTEEPTT